MDLPTGFATVDPPDFDTEEFVEAMTCLANFGFPQEVVDYEMSLSKHDREQFRAECLENVLCGERDFLVEEGDAPSNEEGDSLPSLETVPDVTLEHKTPCSLPAWLQPPDPLPQAPLVVAVGSPARLKDDTPDDERKPPAQPPNHRTRREAWPTELTRWTLREFLTHLGYWHGIHGTHNNRSFVMVAELVLFDLFGMRHLDSPTDMSIIIMQWLEQHREHHFRLLPEPSPQAIPNPVCVENPRHYVTESWSYNLLWAIAAGLRREGHHITCACPMFH